MDVDESRKVTSTWRVFGGTIFARKMPTTIKVTTFTADLHNLHLDYDQRDASGQDGEVAVVRPEDGRVVETCGQPTWTPAGHRARPLHVYQLDAGFAGFLPVLGQPKIAFTSRMQLTFPDELARLKIGGLFGPWGPATLHNSCCRSSPTRHCFPQYKGQWIEALPAGGERPA